MVGAKNYVTLIVEQINSEAWSLSSIAFLHVAGNTFRTAVLEHFQRCSFPTPIELPVHQGDKFFCKLQISGRFTFYDKGNSEAFYLYC